MQFSSLKAKTGWPLPAGTKSILFYLNQKEIKVSLDFRKALALKKEHFILKQFQTYKLPEQYEDTYSSFTQKTSYILPMAQ